MNNKQITALIESARILCSGDIKEGDSNPDKWYELFLYSEKDGSESFESADTFDEIVKFLPRYFNQYPGHRVNIDLWGDREHPKPLCIGFIPAHFQVLYGKGYLHTIEVVINVDPKYPVDLEQDFIYDGIYNGLAEWQSKGCFRGELNQVESEGKPVPYELSWRVIKTDLQEDDSPRSCPAEDFLCISEEIDEVIEVLLDPVKHPDTFARKVRCLQQSGLSKEEAEADVMKTPIQLSLFYSIDQGLFAVEAESVDCISIYNPYDGREIRKIEADE